MFKDVFGEKRDIGDVEKQNLIFEEFLARYPDGQSKSGVSRGAGFKVSCFVQSEGYIKQQKRARQARLWDFELFCNRMKVDRQWDVPRCRSEWKLLSADLSLEHDMGGPPHSRERNEIPPNLTGDDARVTEDIAYTERRIDSSTRAKNLKDCDIAQIRSELTRGFGDGPDVSKLLQESHLALAAGSITCDPSPRKELRDMIVGAVKGGSASGSDGGASASAEPAAAASSASILEPKKEQTQQQTPAQFLSMRNNAKKQTKAIVEKNQKAVVQAILDGAASAAEAKKSMQMAGLEEGSYCEFAEALAERSTLAETFLGFYVDSATDQGGEYVGEDYAWLAQLKSEFTARPPAKSDEAGKSQAQVAKKTDEAKDQTAKDADKGEKDANEGEQEQAPAKDAKKDGAMEAKAGEDDMDDKQEEESGGVAPPEAAAGGVAKPPSVAPADGHDAKLKGAIERMTFKPVETSSMDSLTRMRDLADGVGSMTDMKAIEAVVARLSGNESLVKQLVKSIRIATSDFKKAVNDDLRDIKKKKAVVEKQKAADMQQKSAELERKERLRIASIKDGSSFKVKLTEIGHKAMAVLSLSDWTGVRGEKGEMSKPLLIMDPPRFAQVFSKTYDTKDTSADASLARSLMRFQTAFPRNEECLKSGKVVAPLFGPMGLDSALAGFAEIIPQKMRIHSALPSFQAISSQTQLFGSLKDAVHFGLEPNLMSTLYYQVGGVTKIIAAASSEVSQFVDAQGGDKQWHTLRDWLRTLTDPEAKAYKERGYNLYHGTLNKGMALLIPAGFVVATCAAGQADTNQSALKMFFLSTTGVAQTQGQLADVKLFKPPPDTMKVLDMLMDVCSVAALS